METPERFRQMLIRLLRQGKVEDLIGCRLGHCGAVEIRLEYLYEIRLNRHTIAVHTREVERLRHKIGRRWSAAPANIHDRGRLIVDRRSGAILESPQSGGKRHRKNLGTVAL